jgi:hypothetical protein
VTGQNKGSGVEWLHHIAVDDANLLFRFEDLRSFVFMSGNDAMKSYQALVHPANLYESSYNKCQKNLNARSAGSMSKGTEEGLEFVRWSRMMSRGSTR